MEQAPDNLFGDQVQGYSTPSRDRRLQSGGQYRAHVLIDTGPAGRAKNAFDVKKAIWSALERNRVDDVKLSSVRSLPGAGQPPVAVVYPDGVWYEGLSTDDAAGIVDRHLLDDEPVDAVRFTPDVPEEFTLLVVCTFVSQCGPEGGGEVLKYFTKRARDDPTVHVSQSYGCLKECSMGPVACTYPDGRWYAALADHKLDSVWDAVKHGRDTKYVTGKIGPTGK